MDILFISDDRPIYSSLVKELISTSLITISLTCLPHSDIRYKIDKGEIEEAFVESDNPKNPSG